MKRLLPFFCCLVLLFSTGCRTKTNSAVSTDNPLLDDQGRPITTLQQWESQKQKLRAKLARYLYGEIPADTGALQIQNHTTVPLPDCHAVMEEFILLFGRSLQEKVRITRPEAEGQYPVIMRLDYLSDWQYRSPLEEELLSQERYMFVTVARNLLAPDDADDRDVYGLQQYAGEDLGAIGLWAYGAIAALDYLETTNYVNMEQICLTGHSRDGKAAVCAAAMDERIAIVAPNGSGIGGAASLYWRGNNSETPADLATHFPHWFSSEFNSFASRHEVLPVDMIDAFALIAPRAVIRTEAFDDLWANPEGVFETMRSSDSVYEFLQADTRRNAMYMRAGGHGMTEEDWGAIVEFCDFIFYKKEPLRNFDYN